MVVTIDCVKSPHGHYPQFSHQICAGDLCDVTSPVSVTRATEAHTGVRGRGDHDTERESDKYCHGQRKLSRCHDS